MKKYVATIRVELEADSTHARDFLIASLSEQINKQPPRVFFLSKHFPGVGGAALLSTKVSRVRPKKR